MSDYQLARMYRSAVAQRSPRFAEGAPRLGSTERSARVEDTPSGLLANEGWSAIMLSTAVLVWTVKVSRAFEEQKWSA